ncbi:hypothetical protein BHM03_00050546, partial [Ensete ventricosum]
QRQRATTTVVMAAKRNDSSDGVDDVIQATEPGSRALEQEQRRRHNDSGSGEMQRCNPESR